MCLLPTTLLSNPSLCFSLSFSISSFSPSHIFPIRLRINFIAPGVGVAGPSINQQYPSLITYPDKVFLRELTYRLGSERYLTTVLRQIQELRKKWNQRLALKKQAESIVEQDRLILSTARDIPRLANILVRPTLGLSFSPSLSLPLCLSLCVHTFLLAIQEESEPLVLWKFIRTAFVLLVEEGKYSISSSRISSMPSINPASM
jgi:hypothetical protein